MSRRKRLTFWSADENDDSLACSVMDGRKTVTAVTANIADTAVTAEDYCKPYGDYGDGSYEPGDLIDVYDPKQRLRCFIKATKVYTIEFGEVPEEVWRGETFSSAEAFRECHIRCLPQLDLHDRFKLATLHLDLVEVIARHVVE